MTVNYNLFVEVPAWKMKLLQETKEQHELAVVHNNSTVHNYAMRDALKGFKIAPPKKKYKQH